MNSEHDPLRTKSFQLAVGVSTYARNLKSQTKEYVICDQLFRAGTAPGAMVAEAKASESRKDFVHKLRIALKEAHETRYWLILINESELDQSAELESLIALCGEVIAMLIASLNSLVHKRKEK